MSSYTMTLTSQDELPQVVAGLLGRFPKGRPVRISISDELGQDPESEVQNEGFMERLAKARSLLPAAPWQTTEEALRELRAGESD